jgi:hypothetical protein
MPGTRELSDPIWLPGATQKTAAEERAWPSAQPREMPWTVLSSVGMIHQCDDICFRALFSRLPAPSPLHRPGHPHGDDGRDVVASVLQATFEGKGQL